MSTSDTNLNSKEDIIQNDIVINNISINHDTMSKLSPHLVKSYSKLKISELNILNTYVYGNYIRLKKVEEPIITDQKYYLEKLYEYYSNLLKDRNHPMSKYFYRQNAMSQYSKLILIGIHDVPFSNYTKDERIEITHNQEFKKMIRNLSFYSTFYYPTKISERTNIQIYNYMQTMVVYLVSLSLFYIKRNHIFFNFFVSSCLVSMNYYVLVYMNYDYFYRTYKNYSIRNLEENFYYKIQSGEYKYWKYIII